MSKINPIGVHLSPPAYHHAAAVYSRYALADVLAFRWRTCGKLGYFDYCDDDRYEPSRGLVGFADYLELRGLRIAAQRIEVETGMPVSFDAPLPKRPWPFHLPLDTGALIQRLIATTESGALVSGTYLDIVF